MNLIIRLIEKLTGAAGFLAALLVLPLIAITAYEVFARYVLGAPTVWAYELAVMMTGASFILGCAYALREGAHVQIDVFSAKFPPKIRAGLMLAGYVLLFLPVVWWLSCALLAYGLEALESGERSGQSAWNPPVWPFRFIVCAGFVLLALQATAETIKTVRALCGCTASGNVQTNRE